MTAELFSTTRLGALELSNRIVMAPLTRCRAIGGIPNATMATYYAQRSTAGLIISEGTAPEANGLGYARIPGLYSEQQIAGWKEVTAAVHKAGGIIAAQIMHTGRISHSLNMPDDARILAPSAVQAAGAMYTDSQGPQPHPIPEVMTEADIKQAQVSFVSAARNAREAGFDAVELHSANGYLLEQFLTPHTNRRTDSYGGSYQQRIRFGVETAQMVADAIGADRVGMRISPFSTFNDMIAFEGTEETYLGLVEELNKIGLVYLHLVLNPDDRALGFAQELRKAFNGTFVINGGFDLIGASKVLEENKADLVSFGRPFIGNPDLVDRLKAGHALVEADPNTFYTPGPEGYIDYPTYKTS